MNNIKHTDHIIKLLLPFFESLIDIDNIRQCSQHINKIVGSSYFINEEINVKKIIHNPKFRA